MRLFVLPLVVFFVIAALVILPLPFQVRLARGDSMFPTLSASEATLVLRGKDVEVGDIAVYRANGSMIGHRVVSLGEDVVFTRGDSNNFTEEVPMSSVVGKVLAHCPSILFVAIFFGSTFASVFGVIYELLEFRCRKIYK